MAAGTPPTCRLLQLPGELRNKIYRYALITNSRIQLALTHFDEPGILQTCRTIRQETETIFLAENTFRAGMTDYDSDFMIHLHTKSKRLLKSRGAVDLTFSTTQTPNWQKLLVWLESLHCKKVLWGLKADGADQYTGLLAIERQLLGTLFYIAGNHRAKAWEELLRVIERVHVSLKTANPLWT